MRLFFLSFSIAILFSATASADLTTMFRLDAGGMIAGSTLTSTQTGLIDNGVTFDATLTVVGNGSNVSFNANGIGVDGNTINDGESLTFSITTANQSGGTVAFNGFTELDFNSFSPAGPDAATFSTGDSIQNQTLNLFDLTTLTGGAPTNFTITGAASTGTTSFSLDFISGSFTGTTAVPEPNTSLLAYMLTLGMITRRNRGRC